MKFRNSFVTNSSSSSFVVLGINRSIDEYSEAMIKKLYQAAIDLEIIEDNEDNQTADLETMIDCLEYVSNEMYDIFEEVMKDNYLELCTYYHPDYGDLIFGVPLNYLFSKDNKFKDTKVCDVKKQIAEELNKIFDSDFTEKDISYIEETIVDG